MRERDLLAARADALRRKQLINRFSLVTAQLMGALTLRRQGVARSYGPLHRSRPVVHSYTWDRAKRPLDIHIRTVAGVRDRVPPGRYVVSVSVLSRVGGKVIPWRSPAGSGAVASGSAPCALTRVFSYGGRTDDVSMPVGGRVGLLCPRKARLSPTLCLLCELIRIDTSGGGKAMPAGWGVFPLVGSDGDLLSGRYKMPVLKGPLDPTLLRHEDIAQQLTEDVDYWLGNMYFELAPRQRERGGRQEYREILSHTWTYLSLCSSGLSPLDVVDRLTQMGEMPQYGRDGGGYVQDRYADTPYQLRKGEAEAAAAAAEELGMVHEVDAEMQVGEGGVVDVPTGLSVAAAMADAPLGGGATGVSGNALRQETEEEALARIERDAPTRLSSGMRTVLGHVTNTNATAAAGIVSDDAAEYACQPRSVQDAGLLRRRRAMNVGVIARCLLSELGLRPLRLWSCLLTLFMACLLLACVSSLHLLLSYWLLLAINANPSATSFHPLTGYVLFEPRTLSLPIVGIATLAPPVLVSAVAAALLPVLVLLDKPRPSLAPPILWRGLLLYAFVLIPEPVLSYVRARLLVETDLGAGLDASVRAAIRSDVAQLALSSEYRLGSSVWGVMLYLIGTCLAWLFAGILVAAAGRLYDSALPGDTLARLSSPYPTPMDLEVSVSELEHIVHKAERWRGPKGGRRRTKVADYVGDGPQDPSLGDQRLVDLTIVTVHRNGRFQLYRHFLRRADGAIVEIT
ncbi:hypothetical protein KIPB_002544 [Kipferlia bialata]|uniref:Uncharacterized protein n=1 Tax=Kipferlia bialata TaxID=797122 RepID=A0A9K3GG83_9EUKA|nr:hypothetical protein KIPB_002544 [Kipferlia bialata]|eukprot:g2544.t1